MGAGCVVVQETGAMTNLVCVKLLGRHNSILGRWGVPGAGPYPARARFKFGDGRPGEVRVAEGIPAEIAGGRGKWTAFGQQADAPAVMRKGALGALGGKVDSSRHASPLNKQRVNIPPK